VFKAERVHFIGENDEGRMITNLRYADDIILLATSEAEFTGVGGSPRQSPADAALLINVDKTKIVMASDGIECRVLLQNELLEQVDTFPYLESLIIEDGESVSVRRNSVPG